MPYFISNEQDDCAGWATIKISDDGEIETIGCHETMNDAVAQMIAVSLDEGIDPGGEYLPEREARQIGSFQASEYPMFDREFAEMIRLDHPDIWDEGGNIRGNDQYEILTRIAEQGGVADTDAQEAALDLREAWIARHLRDFRLAGVVAQIKWLAIGSRGEDYMKELIREEIADREAADDRGAGKRAQLHNVREVRQYGMSNLEVRDDEASDSITFAGYASVFNHDYEVHDAFGVFTERLAPGAFTRTLSESPDVMLLVNHEGLPLARTKSGTLRLSEDSIGLRVEAELDPYDPDVRALLPKMRRGDLDEMSFAFRVNGQEWSDDYAERTITEVNLARGDVSIVSFGANPATIAALRAALSDETVRQALFASDDAAKALVPAPAEEVAVDELEVVEEPVKVAKPRKKVSKTTVDDAVSDVEDETAERISTLDYLTRLVDARRLD
jgi:HK97 family phage prohead protease